MPPAAGGYTISLAESSGSKKRPKTHKNTSKDAPLAASSRLPLHSLLAVTWEDAAFDLDKDPGILLMTTVGYLVRQNSQLLTLAGEAGGEMDYFRSYTAIPASLIRSIKHLQPV